MQATGPASLDPDVSWHKSVEIQFAAQRARLHLSASGSRYPKHPHVHTYYPGFTKTSHRLHCWLIFRPPMPLRQDSPESSPRVRLPSPIHGSVKSIPRALSPIQESNHPN
ncbi:hypothetical protein VTK26DRAFT_4120 [Humicola hyalothermophila]